jgi:hypothetical protein
MIRFRTRRIRVALSPHGRSGSFSTELGFPRHVRVARADTVEKAEKRETSKISRRTIFSCLRCCDALQDRYEGPWSFLCETMCSLTSARAKRIGGPKHFRSSAEKDVFNTICQQETSARLFVSLASDSPTTTMGTRAKVYLRKLRRTDDLRI